MAVLTFAGPEFVGGSLADGNYTLTVRADRVHDRWGRELDGDGDGSAGATARTRFFRLYRRQRRRPRRGPARPRPVPRHASAAGPGDPDYLWYFDVNGDDRVGVIDLVAFARRLGSRLNP